MRTGTVTPMGAFVVGLCTGLAAAALLLAGSVQRLRTEGLAVPIETASIRRQLDAELRSGVRQELPVALQGLKKELAGRGGAEAARRLSNLTINLDGMVVTLPPEVVSQVQAQLDGAIKAGTEAALPQAEVERLADQMAARASERMANSLQERLAAQSLVVRPFPWLKVPVRLAAE
ncbi:MAG: hypothetical protein ACM3XM_20810 [Mycobacterium leprae]